MQFILTLLTNLPYLNPILLAGWLVWFGFAGLLGVALYNWRIYHPKWMSRSWGTFGILLIATIIGALFVGIELPVSALPVPGVPEVSPGSTMMIFSAIPWVLAGGWLGPLAAGALGLVSGLLRGIWDTHSLFTILELSLMGALFAVSARQRYRTPFYRLLRQPLVGALSLVAVHVVVFVFSAFFSDTPLPSTAARLDYALSNAGVASLAFGGEILLAGLVAQVLAIAYPVQWGGLGSLQPSPAEKSIETRFISGTGTIITVLLITLLLGDWIIAGRVARNLLSEQLESVAQVGSQSVPFFLEAGQNLASQIAAEPQLSQTSDPDLSVLLGQQIQSVPYFNQLILYDLQINSNIATYPVETPSTLTLEEEEGVLLAGSGLPNQMYAIPPGTSGGAARISFMVLLPGAERVLIARTDLDTNPYMRSLVNSLNSLNELNGAGMLIDEQGTVIYHPQPAFIGTTYPNERPDQPGFNQETASNGTRQLVYYQPITGHPWVIVLTVPAQETQQIAIDIAWPISVMIILLGLFALISLRLSLRTVTGSLHGLATEAKHIATGKLDRPLQTTGGVDEVGELRRAFEQMRVSLQGRLDELNRLLVASQGVASTLQLDEALDAILKAVVDSGASSARIVLVRDMIPGLEEIPFKYASGPEKDVYMHLDQQILARNEKQDRLVMAALTRTRGLDLDPNLPQPASLSAVALRHENRYFGVLWAAYKEQHVFSEADISFMTTLASQAALAVANIRLFLAVEASRRQLETVLNSTPDPVLVTDANSRLILANPAASQLFGILIRKGERQDLQRTIQIKSLYELLQASSENGRTTEVTMPDGKTYLATASAMITDDRTVGRVCIMRDISQLKEMDTLKSEFVSTVSHDLRSPLTLMRGYATMLEMAGELNDQQKNYAKMIVQGVDNMSKLVNNLLDLGRIEFGVGLQVESIPILSIIERVTGDLQVIAREKEISLSVEIPKDIPHAVEADQALLYQAMYNLVENAIKYTPEGEDVMVLLHPSPTDLTFAIQDSGIGIPKDDIEKLFEKFYRGTNREALKQRGTGLGLAIVKSVAERHNGKVWVKSELGKGSIFYLQIPLAQSQESEPQ
ncbi:MAG TPA: ATP-binding protein [Anaerolineales bacterium]|nr:ATP-binding protein [Anaerolineales bacterium]